MLVFGDLVSCTLLDSLTVELLVRHLGVMLSQVRRVSGSKTDDGLSALVDDVDSDNHWIECFDLVANLESIEVQSRLGIHLTKNVGHHTKHWFLSCEFLLNEEVSEELRDNTVFVEVLLDFWLVLLIFDDYQSLLALFNVGEVGLNALDVGLLTLGVLVAWDLDPQDLSVLVVDIPDQIHTEGALAFLNVFNELSDHLVVVLMINNGPLLLAELKWLSVTNLSVLEGFEVTLSTIMINDPWRRQLLAINLGHDGVDLNSPLLESFIILELGDHLVDALESLLSSDQFVALNVLHLPSVLSEVLWQTCLKAHLSWEVNFLIVTVLDLVDVEQRLLIIELDVVDLLEIFLHIGLSERWLITLEALVVEGQIHVVEVVAHDEPIDLVRAGIVLGDHSNTRLIGIATVEFTDDLFITVAIAYLLVDRLIN